MLISNKDRELLDLTNIFHYIFMWEDGMGEEDLYKHEGKAAVALGLTSLLNHSDKPNAEVRKDYEKGEIKLVALREILPGEEVTIDYQMRLWFRKV